MRVSYKSSQVTLHDIQHAYPEPALILPAVVQDAPVAVNLVEATPAVVDVASKSVVEVEA